VKDVDMFRRNILHLSSGSKSKQGKKPAKVGGKLSLQALPPIIRFYMSCSKEMLKRYVPK
jgi:hypothetical protein